MSRSVSAANASGRIFSHLAVELGISGLIDLSHAPLTNEGGELVVTEPCADAERH